MPLLIVTVAFLMLFAWEYGYSLSRKLEEKEAMERFFRNEYPDRAGSDRYLDLY